jgi:nitroreductase
MNMLNAIHMLGYGGMWVTGLNTYDPKVNAWLGFESPSRLVGFLAVGTAKAAPRIERAPRDEHVREWRA